MTCIIAIETATEACSAALLIEKAGKLTIHNRFQLAPREHTKLILPMLDEVLAAAELQIADVDAIAFGRGPGAFTGLRIATGIAQGLALSIDKPTIPVSSLTAMAQAAQKESSADRIIVSIDARMGEVYWAEYAVANDNIELMGDEQLSVPAVMFETTKARSQSADNKALVLIGSGWDVYIGEFKDDNPELTSIQHVSNNYPDAVEISELALSEFAKGKFQSIEEAQPVYLRNNVAEKSKKKI